MEATAKQPASTAPPHSFLENLIGRTTTFYTPLGPIHTMERADTPGRAYCRQNSDGKSGAELPKSDTLNSGDSGSQTRTNQCRVRRKPSKSPYQPARTRITLRRSAVAKLISKLIANSKAKVVWHCSEGHRWKAQISKVKHGTRCPVCAGTRKLELKHLRQIARRRGG